MFTLVAAAAAAIYARFAAIHTRESNTISRDFQKPRLIVTLDKFDRFSELRFNVCVTNVGGTGCAVVETSYRWEDTRLFSGTFLHIKKAVAVASGETKIVRNVEVSNAFDKPNNKFTIEIQLDGPFLEAGEKTIVKSFNVFAEMTYPMREDYTDLSDA